MDEKRGSIGELRSTDRLCKPPELAVVPGTEHQLAVACAIGGERLDAGMDVAEPARDTAVGEPAGRLVGEHREVRAQEVDRHPLSAAGVAARVERSQHGNRAVERGDDVDDRDARLRRGVGRARDAHQPADRLDDRVVAEHVAAAAPRRSR